MMPSILSLFGTSLINSVIQEHEYLNLISSDTKTTLKLRLWRENAKILSHSNGSFESREVRGWVLFGIQTEHLFWLENEIFCLIMHSYLKV